MRESQNCLVSNSPGDVDVADPGASGGFYRGKGDGSYDSVTVTLVSTFEVARVEVTLLRARCCAWTHPIEVRVVNTTDWVSYGF